MTLGPLGGQLSKSGRKSFLVISSYESRLELGVRNAKTTKPLLAKAAFSLLFWDFVVKLRRTNFPLYADRTSGQG